MRTLARVTLCCIDTAHHELALTALRQCVEKCRFARVLFITDRDYMTVPAGEIYSLKSVLTIVGGKVVYDAATTTTATR